MNTLTTRNLHDAYSIFSASLTDSHTLPSLQVLFGETGLFPQQSAQPQQQQQQDEMWWSLPVGVLDDEHFGQQQQQQQQDGPTAGAGAGATAYAYGTGYGTYDYSYNYNDASVGDFDAFWLQVWYMYYIYNL